MNIETCLANRVALAAYLNPKRFHWVFFVDSSSLLSTITI